jgi:hypothetical protein
VVSHPFRRKKRKGWGTEGWFRDLKELAELLRGQSGVPHDSLHGESMDRIIAGDRQDARSIRHHHVDAFAKNPEARIFKRGHRGEIRDAANPGRFIRGCTGTKER